MVKELCILWLVLLGTQVIHSSSKQYIPLQLLLKVFWIAPHCMLYIVFICHNLLLHGTHECISTTQREYLGASTWMKINCIKYSIYVFTPTKGERERRWGEGRETQKLSMITNAIKKCCSCNACGEIEWEAEAEGREKEGKEEKWQLQTMRISIIICLDLTS